MLGKKLKRRMLNSCSAQAALEFLVAYGWAILAVVVAVAVLAYFGVLSADAFLPERCSLKAGIVCLDYKVESYRVILVLQNALGETITINKLTISGNNQECSDSQSITLYNHEKMMFTIQQCSNGAGGQKFNGMINVSYTIEDKLSHLVSGNLKAKIVSGSSVSDQNVCQNAQNNGLCGGLDIVYGDGYQDACCGEHSLCCA